MEDLPRKIRHRRFATQRVRHTNVTENLSIGQTFATVPMWKIRHTTMIGWVRGVGLGVGGVRGVGIGGLELGSGVWVKQLT